MNELTNKITKPTLVVDLAKVDRNIDRMVKKARANKVVLRPHFKTHQSSEIGRLFLEKDVEVITVSSVDMASYFADSGWKDITIAFPVNPRQIEQINELAGRIQLNIMFESIEAYKIVGKQLASGLAAWIKIDTGYHRTGLAWSDLKAVLGLTEKIVENGALSFEGILTHAGHTYNADSVDGIRKIYSETVDRMDYVKNELQRQGYGVKVSVGDTPGCSVVDKFGSVDEIRPGNFVFFDLMQENLGACHEDDIAVAVACPVVAKNRDRGEIVIYGGAVHFSKESLLGSKGTPYFGRIALPVNGGWSDSLRDCWLRSLTQEHGIIEASKELMEAVAIGDLVLVYPVHSCLTANLMGKYLTTGGQPINMARIN